MPIGNQNMQRWISPTQRRISSKQSRVWKKPKIVDRKLSKFSWLVIGSRGLKLGNFTDIGAFTVIIANNGVTIGDNVQIGSHCSILSASTIDDKYGPVVLKKNCKIGTHSTVMPNITVGENSTIGAYSFVNINIPDNVMAFGVPIKIYKKIENTIIKN